LCDHQAWISAGGVWIGRQRLAVLQQQRWRQIRRKRWCVFAAEGLFLTLLQLAQGHWIGCDWWFP
jgi:hypothetical protein